MLHVINFRRFEYTNRDLVSGHGRCKGNLYTTIIFLFRIQSNHPNYTLLLISTAEVSEAYIWTNSGIKADKGHFRNREKSTLIRNYTRMDPNRCSVNLISSYLAFSRGIDTIGRCATGFTRETTFVTVCLPAQDVLSKRGSTLFFSFRVELFS